MLTTDSTDKQDQKNKVELSKKCPNCGAEMYTSIGGRMICPKCGHGASKNSIFAIINEMISDNEDVRERTFEALKNLGDEAVEPLIQTLEHKNIKIRRQAAEVLGMINTKYCIQALIKIFSDSRPEMFRRVNYSLWLIGVPAVSSLVEKLRDDDPNVRGKAAIVLGEMIHRRRVDPSDQNWLDPSAIDATDNIRADIDVQRVMSEVRGPLKRLLNDSDKRVRHNALYALERIR